MLSKNIIKSNDIFEKIKPYMLTLDNIKNYEKPIAFAMLKPKARSVPIETHPISTRLLKTSSVETSLFSPKQKDSLFWCYFIIKNGFSAYEYPGITTFVNEKELKFKCIEELRKSKQTLKVKKIKNLREDVENELGNKEKIGMKTFIALCISSNINVLFIHKKKCFELFLDENEAFYVIHQREENGHIKYYYEVNASKESIDKYKKTFFAWDNVDKPLKAPSAYNLEELQNLCNLLGISSEFNNKKKLKKDLYDLLLMEL